MDVMGRSKAVGVTASTEGAEGSASSALNTT